MTFANLGRAGLISLAACLLMAPPSAAFYQMDGEGYGFSAKASVRALGVASRNPGDKTLYPRPSDDLEGVMARLALEGSWGGWLAVEVNGFALGLQNSAGAKGSSPLSLMQAERSPLLEWGLWEDGKSKGEMALDWADIRLTSGPFDLIIGRQPVNLATTLYFTPNDFFAPFSAETFFRVYKAGVDAARLEASLGPLAQLTLLWVAGYAQNPDTVNGYSTVMDDGRSSYLARVSAVALDCEFTALAGKARRSNVYGGSLQGTIRDWLGVRMEGHWTEPLDKGGRRAFEGTVEIERRYPNSLDLRLALFHHGAGVEKTTDYMKLLLSGKLETPYLARWYAAAGASLEFTPLLSGQALAILNAHDNSFTVSVNAVYSISNEGELFAGVSVPSGNRPQDGLFHSEFGARPASASLEVRYYF